MSLKTILLVKMMNKSWRGRLESYIYIAHISEIDMLDCLPAERIDQINTASRMKS